ncbi:MAG TPA: hypothetical protein VL860_14320, partial [Planctomycetota bacterium]|nr:hypothetical protein [Planctomycetota bacterium]
MKHANRPVIAALVALVTLAIAMVGGCSSETTSQTSGKESSGLAAASAADAAGTSVATTAPAVTVPRTVAGQPLTADKPSLRVLAPAETGGLPAIAAPAAFVHTEAVAENAAAATAESGPAGNAEPAAEARFELSAIDANPEHAGATAGRADRFHDWAILATVPVTDADLRTGLLAALADCSETHCRRGTCFRPEYGLRVQEPGHLVEY